MDQQTVNPPADRVTLPNHMLPAPRADGEHPPARRSRLVTIFVVLALLAAIAGGYWLWHRHAASSTAEADGKGRGGVQNRTIPVVATPVHTGDLDIFIDGLGSVVAFNTVTVRSRVDGQIMKVAFSEGQQVKEGDALVEIDPRSFQAALDQAEGQLAKDQSVLRNSQLDLERFQQAKETLTQQQLDTQAAVVSQNEGVVKSDQASVENAKLQLSYSHVTSPITGRTGLRLVDVGNIVHASDATGLVVVTQLQPISVVFSVPQDNLSRVLQRPGGGQGLRVDAVSRDLRTKIASGKLEAIDNQVDVTTGTVRMKATYENKDNTLFPNQFVNARLLVDTLKDVQLVPAAGVQYGPESTFAYVVKPDQTVEMRTIAIGATEGGQVVVTSGLSAGEVVVTDGVDKLQQGSKVTVSKGAGRGQGGRGSANASSQPSTMPGAEGSHPSDGVPNGRRRGQGEGQGGRRQ